MVENVGLENNNVRYFRRILARQKYLHRESKRVPP